MHPIKAFSGPSGKKRILLSLFFFSLALDVFLYFHGPLVRLP